jgi:hypothetical protein
MRRIWVVTGGVVGAILMPAVARAQSVSDQAAAEALFKQARDLMAGGDYAQACPKLAESERLDPSAGTMLNLASCYEKNGQLASAWVTFKGAATAAQRANEPERAKLARARAAKLEPRLPTLTITVAAGADLPDLVVTRDDQKVGRAEWGTPIPIDPGAHAVEASAAGHKTWQTQARVDGPGAKASVEIPPLATDSNRAAPAVEAAPAPAPSPPPPSRPPPSSPGSTQRVVGVVVAGLGVAGVAAGSVFGVIAKSHESDATPHCSGSECDAVGITALNQAHDAATVSTIGFVAGGAAIAGGVVIYLVAPRGSPGTGLFLAPGAAGSVAGLTLRGGW